LRKRIPDAPPIMRVTHEGVGKWASRFKHSLKGADQVQKPRCSLIDRQIGFGQVLPHQDVQMFGRD